MPTSVLSIAIIIILGIAGLIGLDILINKLRQKKRSRKWKRKGRG